MRSHIVFSLCLALAGAACMAKPDQRTFALQGQLLSVDSSTRVLIKHEAVKGLMPAMTMPYEVRDGRLLEGLAPGDLIDATLVVESNAAYLAAITKVGSAPLEKPPADQAPPASAARGFEPLKPGDAVPEGRLVDQDGRPRDITHNLRTAIVDAEGRLVTTHTGNQWSPEQLLAELKPIAGAY